MYDRYRCERMFGKKTGIRRNESMGNKADKIEKADKVDKMKALDAAIAHI